MTTASVYIEADGRAVGEAELFGVAQSGYGHFTAMQVRDGRVRGLDLHLARLDAATRELFGTGLDGGRVRALVRQAMAAAHRRDAATRVHVYRRPGGEVLPVVTVREPVTTGREPRSLMSVPYQRPVPHIKHLGGFGQLYYGTEAERAGFDEALLTGPGGVISEGSITNIAFWDGTSVIWPDAPCLRGITMALLEPLLPSTHAPVTLSGLPSFRAAFVTNARGIAPVRRIDGVTYEVDEDLMKRVYEAYESVEWDEI